MSEAYAYLGQWNYSTNAPVPDYGWLSVDEARQRWDEGSKRFDVVRSSVHEAQTAGQAVVPPWVLTCWEGGQAFTVSFLNAVGSVWRVIEYRREDGRLFKGAVYEYTFPDETRRYRAKEARLKTHGIFRPDGTGVLTVDDKSQPTVDRLSMDQVDVSANWMPVPDFGDWEQIVDPDYAAAPSAS